MKNHKLFKTHAISATFIVGVAINMLSCNMGQDDSKKLAEKQNKENLESRLEEKDAQFLVDLAEINMEEIQLGQLAQSKSTNKEVKDMGKMMEDEHTKALNELKEIASKKGIIIPASPTEEVKNSYEKLSKKDETQFNEDYCDKMVKGHKDAIDKVEKAATGSTDQEIKTWANSALSDLKKNLDHAMTCQGNVKSESSFAK